MIKFLILQRLVVAGLLLSGLMMNVNGPSSHCVPVNEQLGVRSSYWMTLFQLLHLGTPKIFQFTAS